MALQVQVLVFKVQAQAQEQVLVFKVQVLVFKVGGAFQVLALTLPCSIHMAF